MTSLKEIFEEISNVTLEMDANYIRQKYDKRDVMNVLLMLMHVIHNYKFDRDEELNRSLELRMNEAEMFGNEMHELVLYFTGIDTKDHNETT